MPKQEPTLRTLAAVNDISTGLQMIEYAIASLQLNDDDKAAFQRFANKLAATVKRRVTVETMKEHVASKDARDDMTISDWIEFTY